MKIEWQIETEDAARVRDFFKKHRNDPFVRRRIARNLNGERRAPTRNEVWNALVTCLLTTQQKSGPKSAVARFNQTKPFPLEYGPCAKKRSLAKFVQKTLSTFGGLRRFNVIAVQIAANCAYLKAGGWNELIEHLEQVRAKPNPTTERRAAEFLDEHIKGFGPKQSRNLLQMLGLSRYEIPIDSRITKWLNDFGFPITLTANALQDRNYYNMIGDGFQQLCRTARIKPCALDAAIFASFDG